MRTSTIAPGHRYDDVEAFDFSSLFQSAVNAAPTPSRDFPGSLRDVVSTGFVLPQAVIGAGEGGNVSCDFPSTTAVDALHELRVALDGKGWFENDVHGKGATGFSFVPDAAGPLTHNLPSDFMSARATTSGGTATNTVSSGGVVTTYNAGSANGSAGYDIRIDFKGSGWTQALQAPFIKMADYLASNIIGDLPGSSSYNGKAFDDLYVTAQISAIDGVGGVLGQAGPTSVWTANNLTAVGAMQFDSADAANYAKLGLWDDIVVHEFMHVEGFGSLWNYGRSLVPTAGQYVGAKGLAAYKQTVDPTATYVPVETGGGSGTAGSHWSEARLTNELMTGYINSSNHLDAFSIQSLADLGYALKSTVDPLLV